MRSHVLQWELCQEISISAPPGTPHVCELKINNTPVATLARPAVSFFKDQMGLVQAWGELRLDRTAEILAQIDNQSPFVAAVIGLHPERHRFTIELLVNAIQFTVLVEMQFKHALACWRPHQFSPQVQPMITTPGHGAFPSGHATQAFMLARLLDGLLDLSSRVPATALQLYRQAARIATNRVVAGVHFPADSIAGRLLEHVIAEYVLARLGVRSDVRARLRHDERQRQDPGPGPHRADH